MNYPRLCLVVSLLALSPIASANAANFSRAPSSCSNNTINSLISTNGRSFDAGTGSCVDGNEGCSPMMFGGTQWVDHTILTATSPELSGLIVLAATKKLQTPDTCLRTPLTQSLKWLGTAVWLDYSNEIMAVNPLGDQLIRISTSGVVRPDESEHTLVNLQNFSPARIERLPNGYLLTSIFAETIVIDSKYQSRISTGNIKTNPNGDITGIRSITDLAVSGNDVIAYGALNAGTTPDKASFELGFFHAKLQTKPLRIDKASIILPLSNQKYYLLGHRYIAATNDGISFVAMGERASIYWYPLSAKEPKLLKKSLPEMYTKIPPITSRLTGPTDTPAVFGEVENFKIPVGLYGQGRFIYLLTREPTGASGSGTTWLLHKIDPRRDEFIDSVRLPTTANHITIVPSPNAWHIFEKGKVTGYMQQTIASVISVPTKWIINTQTSPLNRRATEYVSCQPIRQEAQSGK